MRRWADPRGEECEAISLDPGSAPYIRPYEGVLAELRSARRWHRGDGLPNSSDLIRDTASAAMVMLNNGADFHASIMLMLNAMRGAEWRWQGCKGFSFWACHTVSGYSRDGQTSAIRCHSQHSAKGILQNFTDGGVEWWKPAEGVVVHLAGPPKAWTDRAFAAREQQPGCPARGCGARAAGQRRPREAGSGRPELRAFPSATKAGANLKRIIAGLPGTGRQYLEPLVLALAEGRCGLIELGPADPWPSNVITLYPAQKPLAIVFDDRDGVGPRQWKAAPRARWWVKAAYVAAGCRPVGARLLELTDAHKRLVVIETTVARAEAWAVWLKSCPLRKFAQLRVPAAPRVGGYTRARVLAAAVQARTTLIENSDAARRLSVEEVAALAEAIEAIDGLIEVVRANVSRSGGPAGLKPHSFQKRAETVMNFLISQGVKPAMLSARGFGEADPVASNNTAAGRAQNRRVELTLSAAPAS